MAIVVDAAREDNTDNVRHVQIHVSVPETHIPFAYEAPVVSNTDAWVPIVTTGSDIV